MINEYPKTTSTIWFVLSMIFLPLILWAWGWILFQEQTLILQQPTVAEIRILEVVSNHAWESHGTQVNSAIKCLENNGSYKSFRTSFTDNKGNKIPTNVWICFDGKEWYAIITTTFQKIAENKVARLVTAYSISKDIFPTIDDFINYIGLKWNAREIQYVIDAGKILLEPK